MGICGFGSLAAFEYCLWKSFQPTWNLSASCRKLGRIWWNYAKAARNAAIVLITQCRKRPRTSWTSAIVALLLAAYYFTRPLATCDCGELGKIVLRDAEVTEFLTAPLHSRSSFRDFWNPYVLAVPKCVVFYFQYSGAECVDSVTLETREGKTERMYVGGFNRIVSYSMSPFLIPHGALQGKAYGSVECGSSPRTFVRATFHAKNQQWRVNLASPIEIPAK